MGWTAAAKGLGCILCLATPGGGGEEGTQDSRVQVREVRGYRRNGGLVRGRGGEVGRSRGLEASSFHQSTGHIHLSLATQIPQAGWVKSVPQGVGRAAPSLEALGKGSWAQLLGNPCCSFQSLPGPSLPGPSLQLPPLQLPPVCASFLLNALVILLRAHPPPA